MNIRKFAIIAGMVLLVYLANIGVIRLVKDWDKQSVTFTACDYEDSDNCYWDSSVRGNGTGTSFVRYNGVTIYLKK